MVLWSSAGPAGASTDPQAAVVGDASAIEAGVEVRGGANAPFVLLQAVEPVAVGDGVRTDTTGFAEIAYFDGSRTRLDIDTEFEVVELVDDAGVSSTRTSMGIGRTWHRVESLGEGEFTVETSQATATVRGTAFVLDCISADNCTYLVFEGIIEVTLGDGSVIEVVGPAEVVVVGGVAGPVTPVTLDRLLADPWFQANASRDVAAGFADLEAFLGASDETTTTEPSTTSTTSTTTADTSSTTTSELPTSTSEESTTTTEAAISTTETPTSTTEVSNEPSTSSTTTSSSTTTTEWPTEQSTSTTTTSSSTTTTEPPPSTSTTTTSTTTTSSTTTSTTTSTTSTTTSTTTTLPTTTTTNPPKGVPICHSVGGDHYQHIVVDPSAADVHLRVHPDDYRPGPSGSCKAATTATRAISVPPSTTTTTAPELATTSARAVTEAVPPDTTAPAPPPTDASTATPAPVTTAVPTTALVETTAPVETTVAADTTIPVETAEMAVAPDTTVTAELVVEVERAVPAEPAAERPAGWASRALWRLGIS